MKKKFKIALSLQILRHIQNWTSSQRPDLLNFVQNSLCCNMGMIIFDLQGYAGCLRPKTPYLGAYFAH